MTATSAVLLVARREVVERVRARSFAISTAILLLIVVAVVLAGRFVGGGPTTYDVAVVGPAAPIADLLRQQGQAVGISVTVQRLPDRTAAEQALRADKVDLALVDDSLVVRRDLPEPLRALAVQASRTVAAERILTAAGVSADTAQRALSPPPPTLQTLEPVDAERDTRRGIAYAGTIVLYGQLIGYGVLVANGVIEEKSSRVVELLLAAIRPRQLLVGKVAGLGLLALGQLLVVSGVGVGLGAAIGAFTVPASVLGVLGQVLLWFLLGFTLYACVYAAAAATVSRQEDLQNATTPLNLALVGSFFGAVYAFGSPDSPVTTALSLIPPLSALVMPVRYAGGDVPWWQVLAAVLLMLAAIVVLLRLAARIYTNSVLRLGARVGWREALRGTRG